MNIPAGFTKAEIDALKTANPGTVFAAPLAADETIPTDAPPQRILGWLDLLEIPLEAGETLVLPGPVGIMLAGLTKAGLVALRAKLTAAPITERWTIARIQAEMAALPVPKT